MSEIVETVINLSHAFFSTSPATPDTLNGFIDRMQVAFPEESIDRSELFNLLESIHTITIPGEASILEDASGHEEWFNPDTNAGLSRDIHWHFWDHYNQYLRIKKKWPSGVVNNLDKFSSLVLSRLENPLRDGSWDRRGMVVGNVQSGKTSNYTALITKAADAGYKLIVVLAGVHNSLRSQTQARLNEELLGYDLDVIRKLKVDDKRIGVRQMFKDHQIAYTLTSSAENGDFNKSIAGQVGMFPSQSSSPILLVVKKNKSILENLIAWATSLATSTSDGRSIVEDVPILLIDDECDFASVNTKKSERDESGNIIDEWNPTTINRLIRELLNSFMKSIYVGYTATPFANIFIHHEDPSPVYGRDIFPRHFIIKLPSPTNYFGPEEVFGLKGDPDASISPVQPLPLLRKVDDNASLIPSSHKNGFEVPGIPESLKCAIKSFLLVCAARRVRGRGNTHNSMLVHVTRFVNVQEKVKMLVEQELKRQVARIMSGSDKLADYRALWESDFTQTTKEMSDRGIKEAREIKWKEIRDVLYDSSRLIKIKTINGSSADTLEYRDADHKTKERIRSGENVPWQKRGISAIVIGGDKLSRGLTLDGLSVSYFLRASRMYDTLMQMGRWFGYRDGYNDLCRIYTTEDLMQWYRHIALASRELQNQFDYMELTGKKPEEFGLKVRSHPGQLAITSAGKRRSSQKVSITWAGEFPKTVVFDPRKSDKNLRALEKMIDSFDSRPLTNHNDKKPRFHWVDIKPDSVLNFLKDYGAQDEATKVVNPKPIAEYIERQLKKGELTDWHVVVVSKKLEDAAHYIDLAGYRIGCVDRNPLFPVGVDKISIGTLTSPTDEALDLDEKELKEGRSIDADRGVKLTPGDNPTSVTIRKVRPSNKALMLIYLPCYKGDDINTYGLHGQELVGFAISFPHSNTAEPMEYEVNAVYADDLRDYEVNPVYADQLIQ